jgi:hypothetical protein
MRCARFNKIDPLLSSPSWRGDELPPRASLSVAAESCCPGSRSPRLRVRFGARRYVRSSAEWQYPNRMSDPRPFYHRPAWAYDLLLNELIGARIAAIVSSLGKRAVRPCDEVLDAGCGTGPVCVRACQSRLSRFGP